MAEERIVVVDLKKQCEECRQSCEEYDGFYADCSLCPFAEKSIKRTEAIERMALALCKKYYHCSDCKDCEVDSKGDCNLKFMYPQAETALDALIKGE